MKISLAVYFLPMNLAGNVFNNLGFMRTVSMRFPDQSLGETIQVATDESSIGTMKDHVRFIALNQSGIQRKRSSEAGISDCILIRTGRGRKRFLCPANHS